MEGVRIMNNMNNFIVVNDIDLGKHVLLRTKYIRSVTERDKGCAIEVKYDDEAPIIHAVSNSFKSICGLIMLGE